MEEFILERSKMNLATLLSLAVSSTVDAILKALLKIGSL
jgi:hypothetical protein